MTSVRSPAHSRARDGEQALAYQAGRFQVLDDAPELRHVARDQLGVLTIGLGHP
ncbi:MAG: hypothetical protein AB7N65_30850 [Vicinamibacterales bacterium]